MASDIEIWLQSWLMAATTRACLLICFHDCLPAVFSNEESCNRDAKPARLFLPCQIPENVTQATRREVASSFSIRIDPAGAYGTYSCQSIFQALLGCTVLLNRVRDRSVAVAFP
jgi:hypothetical protein